RLCVCDSYPYAIDRNWFKLQYSFITNRGRRCECGPVTIVPSLNCEGLHTLTERDVFLNENVADLFRGPQVDLEVAGRRLVVSCPIRFLVTIGCILRVKTSALAAVLARRHVCPAGEVVSKGLVEQLSEPTQCIGISLIDPAGFVWWDIQEQRGTAAYRREVDIQERLWRLHQGVFPGVVEPSRPNGNIHLCWNPVSSVRMTCIQ